VDDGRAASVAHPHAQPRLAATVASLPTISASTDTAPTPAPSPQVVWVRFGTVAASAVGSTGSATAGSDYVAIDRSASSSLVRFAARETSRVVVARVRQDGAVERDERFALTLSAPVNGSLVPPGTTEVATDSRGIGVIRDDDATPVARIADATIAEGTGTGTTAVRLVITLSSPSWRSVSVRFGTVDGTAKGGSASAAGADYVSVVPAATTSLVTFAPGVQTATITVQVRKDAAREVAETFFVDLSSAVNATLRALDGSTNDRRGVVSIRNDD
jgi:large repetitive protein